MALIPTTRHLQVVAAGTAYTFVRLRIGRGNRAVPADVSNGWNVTDLLTPFNPVRQKDNPPGGAVGNVSVVDWMDGTEGDAVDYAANEVGLDARLPDNSVYMAFYESKAAGWVFRKLAGSIVLRRFRLMATGAQLANATFNVSLIAPGAPDASEDDKGLIEIADNAEADADENNARDDRAVTPRKWWRMFTGPRIVARLAALAGNDRLDISAIKNVPTLPPGAMMQFAGAAAPAGWALCQGQAVSRTSATYRALFAAIGSTYGGGDGTTTFNLPDMRRRVPVGAGGMGTGTLGSARGSTGGEEDHLLSTGEMPAHSHSAPYATLASGPRRGAVAGQLLVSNFSLNTSSAGGGRGHNNIQPSLVLNYIIKL